VKAGRNGIGIGRLPVSSCGGDERKNGSRLVPLAFCLGSHSCERAFPQV